MTEDAPAPAEKKDNKALIITLVCVGVGCFVVIPCIALVAAIAIPNFVASRERALEARCRANLRFIGLNCEGYAKAYSVYPDGLDSLNVTSSDPVNNALSCPAARAKGSADASYAWTPERLDRSSPSRTPVARCPKGSHSGDRVGVLHLDSSTEFVRPGEPDYQEAMRRIP